MSRTGERRIMIGAARDSKKNLNHGPFAVAAPAKEQSRYLPAASGTSTRYRKE
jgi:hypothetical protein